MLLDCWKRIECQTENCWFSENGSRSGSGSLRVHLAPGKLDEQHSVVAKRNLPLREKSEPTYFFKTYQCIETGHYRVFLAQEVASHSHVTFIFYSFQVQFLEGSLIYLFFSSLALVGIRRREGFSPWNPQVPKRKSDRGRTVSFAELEQSVSILPDNSHIFSWPLLSACYVPRTVECQGCIMVSKAD